jgi:cytochrome c-type biogenesis protein CcmH/NrfG
MRHLAAVLAVAAVLLPSAPAVADDLANPVYADQKDAKSLTAYAAKLIEDTHCSAAIPFLQLAVEVDPSYADAYLNLGIAYADGGRADKAIEAYERYLALRPQDPRRADVEKIIAEYRGTEKAEKKDAAEAKAIAPAAEPAAAN